MDGPLNWQYQCREVPTRLKYLLDNAKLSDCVFIIEEDEYIETFPAHKLVMAMASPTFETMFYGSLPPKADDRIRIYDVTPRAFRCLLDAIYTDRCSFHTLELAMEVRIAAEKYMLPAVSRRCSQYMAMCLKFYNSYIVYEHAKLYEDEELMASCKTLFLKQAELLMAEKFVTNASFDTLCDIFDLDGLHVKSELFLFNVLERYIATRSKHVPVVGYVDEEESDSLSADENPQTGYYEFTNEDGHGTQKREILPEDTWKIKNAKYIKRALSKIRFLTLTPTEFLQGPAQSELFTKDEVFHILANISYPDNSKFPMPVGFSTNRFPRSSNFA